MKNGGPFGLATVIPEDKIATLVALRNKPKSFWRAFFDHDPSQDEIDAAIAQAHATTARGEIWKNKVYQVIVDRKAVMTHLSIKRIDRQPVHDWRDMQEIKNELVGPEHEAVELYPRESRLVDTANQYHLWVLTNSEDMFPFGFNNGRILSEESVHKSVNRPFDL